MLAWQPVLIVYEWSALLAQLYYAPEFMVSYNWVKGVKVLITVCW